MTHGSLFSGIGGFDLAAEWMGWDNVFHCEINEFCQKVLNHYWPHAKSYQDIKKTDFTEWRGKIDVISGGFPCQPYSVAGKRKGKADDRHLWPEMLRAIREIQPRWVIGENVHGLINWKRGMVLDEIKVDLATSGFEVFPPFILPACGKDAPHQRNRLWIVAHSDSQRRNDGVDNWDKRHFQNNKRVTKENKPEREGRQRGACQASAASGITNSNSQGLQIGVQPGVLEAGRKNESHKGRKPSRVFTKGDWQQFPTVSPVFVRDDGLSDRLDRITISKWRTESVKGAGNAIVPQVVYEIFKTIEQYETREDQLRQDIPYWGLFK